ncbi:heme-binding protein [Croceivirga lutea]|uniref:heme-binding domain-containing protein n=1 Tax=Croceivirga lutea TaxID=1775167 RepID=UPI00163A6664|nr:heme-binding domain-containing protein [Croceivirga lutea]GGG47380.1 heme-binding protein [Croceivirga lutea]
MKILKIVGLLLLIGIIIIQFFNPEKNISEDVNYVSAFESETMVTKEVEVILKSTCYDCHSAHTDYPWYGSIAPLSFWIQDHIEHGKEELNFSEWTNYSIKKKDHKLEEIIEEVEEGKMPLKEYTYTHKDAQLSKEQVETLVIWAKAARANY